jgi:acetyl esterase/lipase
MARRPPSGWTSSASKPGSPIFVFIHGGYWRMLDAADSTFMAQTFVEAGVAVVAINHALALAASVAEIVRQCRAGLAWVYQNAARLNGDPARIHVSGSSAGGHLRHDDRGRLGVHHYGLPEASRDRPRCHRASSIWSRAALELQ